MLVPKGTLLAGETRGSKRSAMGCSCSNAKKQVQPVSQDEAQASSVEAWSKDETKPEAKPEGTPVAKPTEQTALRSSCEGLKLKPKARVSCTGKENRSANASCKTVETESAPSSSRAVSMVSKALFLAILGLVMTSDCITSETYRSLMPTYLVRFIGAVVLGVALSWLELMRGECERQIFFPSASSNLVCALLFRWECFVFSLLTWAACFPTSWWWQDLVYSLLIPTVVMSSMTSQIGRAHV